MRRVNTCRGTGVEGTRVKDGGWGGEVILRGQVEVAKRRKYPKGVSENLG